MEARWPEFLQHGGRQLLLLGGKGGVGKTTCAVATALYLARRNPEVDYLLVSTDPAHSLAHCLGGDRTPDNLEILELRTGDCLARFKARCDPMLRQIAIRGTFLDDEDISRFLDLSLPGSDELMAFFEIVEWIKEDRYDTIVVDTAPTGHTLNLLAMPRLMHRWLSVLDTMLAKHRFMKKTFCGTYKPDAVDIFLLDLSEEVKQVEELLKDPRQCCFVLVTLAEPLVFAESLDLIGVLEHREIPLGAIIVNMLRVSEPPQASFCPTCTGIGAGQRRELIRAADTLGRYPLWGVPLFAQEAKGEALLEDFWLSVRRLDGMDPGPSLSTESPSRPRDIPVVENPAPMLGPETRLVLFAGKGGVGKTSLACTTAMHMARPGADRRVLLLSTDPAHSLSDCLGRTVGASPTPICDGLTAMEIDARAELETLKRCYADEFQQLLGSMLPNLDLTFDREVIERILDLSPPGVDEIMALTKSIHYLDEGKYDLFIFDTAPTGHLLRLLEMPELMDQWLKVLFGFFLKYKRVFYLPQTSDFLVRLSRGLRWFREMLRDPHRCELYGVSIQTQMALEETKNLIDSCRRLEVSINVLFLNQTTPASDCPLCTSLRQHESEIRRQFQEAFPELVMPVVYRGEMLQGLENIERLGGRLYQRRG